MVLKVYRVTDEESDVGLNGGCAVLGGVIQKGNAKLLILGGTLCKIFEFECTNYEFGLNDVQHFE